MDTIRLRFKLAVIATMHWRMPVTVFFFFFLRLTHDATVDTTVTTGSCGSDRSPTFKIFAFKFENPCQRRAGYSSTPGPYVYAIHEKNDTI